MQTLSSHTAPITALDFNEPYGFLVSASQDGSARLWDLCSGEEVGRLSGHHGMVKCLQVEDQLCLTGGADNSVRIWDLRRVERDEDGPQATHVDKDTHDINAIQAAKMGKDTPRDGDACDRVLEGHSKPVSSLFFEGNVLVSQ